MIHSYTFEKLGRFFVYLIGVDNTTLEEMQKNYLRYDNNIIPSKAMFVFMDREEYENFRKDYKTLELDNFEEFQLVTKIMR